MAGVPEQIQSMDTTIRLDDDDLMKATTATVFGSDRRSSGAGSSTKWHFCGKLLPRSEIVFMFQVILVYMVVIVSIVNLTIGRADDKLWIALLSSGIGYILPNPTLKQNHNNNNSYHHISKP